MYSYVMYSVYTFVMVYCPLAFCCCVVMLTFSQSLDLHKTDIHEQIEVFSNIHIHTSVFSSIKYNDALYYGIWKFALYRVYCESTDRYK